jgi:hypothetical protein
MKKSLYMTCPYHFFQLLMTRYDTKYLGVVENKFGCQEEKVSSLVGYCTGCQSKFWLPRVLYLIHTDVGWVQYKAEGSAKVH